MNVILNIPHSSTCIPDCYKNQFKLSEEELKKETNLMADLLTDELFPSWVSDRIVCPVSRLVCDVERFEDDSQELMSERGMGVCYTKTHDGKKLKIVSPTMKEEVLNEFYRPYHKKLEKMVARDLKYSKKALIIDCHSFNPEPLECDLDQEYNRPDICLGVDDFHTPKALVEFAFKFFSEKYGLTVEVNTPFSGTMVPLRYYKKDSNVCSMMIEVNKKLYMNTKLFLRNDKFATVQEMLKVFVKELSKVKDGNLNSLIDGSKTDFAEAVETNNDVITCFETVKYLSEDNGRKVFNVNYRRDWDSWLHVQCEYIFGTGSIVVKGTSFTLGRRARKQLLDEYCKIKKQYFDVIENWNKILETNTHCYFFKTFEDRTFGYAKLVKDKKGYPVISNYQIESGVWEDMYHLVSNTKNESPITYLTALELQSLGISKPEVFTEIEGKIVCNTYKDENLIIAKAFLYMHQNASLDDIDELKRICPDGSWLLETDTLYDSDRLTLISATLHVYGGMFRRRRQSIVLTIDGFKFEGVWDSGNGIVVHCSGHKDILIRVSEPIQKRLEDARSKLNYSDSYYDFSKEVSK